MTTETLALRNQSQNIYVRWLTQAWRHSTQVHDPSIWLTREPLLEEKMLRDADIAAAVGYRKHLIAGRQWHLSARVENDPRADLSVAIGSELLEAIKGFTSSRLNLARAFLSGERFARIVMQPRVLDIGDGRRRTWMVPTRLIDVDKRVFRRIPTRGNDEEVASQWERWDIGRMEWVPVTMGEAIRTIRHVYEDDEASLGHGRGLREALGWWWYAKQHVFEDSLKSSDRYGGGIMTAKIDGLRDADGLPNAEAMRAWRRVLEDARSTNVLVHDKADDIEVISGSSEGWQMLGELRRELRNTIATLVLGANLTTQASEGGSYALAEVQENSTEALVQYDRETLEETLTDDLIGCLWHENYPNLRELGIEDLKPRFNITQEKRQDPKERAEVARTLSEMGVSLPLMDVLEQTGFRRADEGEDVIEPRAPAQPMLPGFGL